MNKAEGKCASAHDLRRSFATRWASKGRPATLQLLMRHRSIETTLRFYVAMDSDEVADELWAAHAGGEKPSLGPILGPILGPTCPVAAQKEGEVRSGEGSERLVQKGLQSGGHGTRTRNPITGAPHFQCGR